MPELGRRLGMFESALVGILILVLITCAAIWWLWGWPCSSRL
ncbi:hypothetical protein [Microbacterium halotolerans]|nr:hypothetical protein [Microbacterium halotolerans]